MAGEMKRKNIRITQEQDRFIKAAAEKKGTSENYVMVMAIEKYMVEEMEREARKKELEKNG